MRKKIKGLEKYLFVVYIVILIYLLFLEREIDPEVGVNYEPFYSFKMFYPLLKSDYMPYRYLAFENLFGNILMFIPMGFYLPSLFKKQKKFLVMLLTVICISTSIECIQFFTKLGTTDIDDIILNVFGAIIGYIFYLIVKGKERKDE